MNKGVRHCQSDPNNCQSHSESKSFKLRPRSSNLCRNLSELIELVDAKREALGLTQAELARLAGIDQPSICQLLNQSKKCSYERVKRVAESIGLSLKIRVEVGGMPDNVKKIRRLKALSLQNKEAAAMVTATSNEMNTLKIN
jgi:transcriptional regulator with XRE-family HTH domain